MNWTTERVPFDPAGPVFTGAPPSWIERVLTGSLLNAVMPIALFDRFILFGAGNDMLWLMTMPSEEICVSGALTVTTWNMGVSTPISDHLWWMSPYL